MQWMMRMRGWLVWLADRRGSRRGPAEGLMVYYWTGGATAPRKVGNISARGAYIDGPDHWKPGSVVSLTFAGGSGPAEDNSSPVVRALVIRESADGFAVQFLFKNKDEQTKFHEFVETALARHA